MEEAVRSAYDHQLRHAVPQLALAMSSCLMVLSLGKDTEFVDC
jgi:hypothetical protein